MKTPKAEAKPKEVVPEPPDMQVAKNAREAMLKEAESITKDIERLQGEFFSINDQIQAALESTGDIPQALAERQSQLQMSMLNVAVEKRQRLLNYLYVDKPSLTDFDFVGDVTPRQKAIAQEAAAEFRKLVSPDIIRKGNVKLAQPEDLTRSYYSAYDKTIYISTKGRPVEVVLHEMGHWIERRNIDILEKTVEFLDRRTAGNPLTQLAGHASGEMARDGGFISPYMGKDYPSSTGETKATEILSMGLEYFYSDPVKLATQDPEYFDFIFDLLRGR
jgi:hypothetical protein